MTFDGRPIAVIEDSDEDFAALTRAVRAIEPPVELVRFTDAESFLAQLTSAPSSDGSLAWLVVLLDLNLPGRSGAAVLAHLRADPRSACIPVVVVSGSAHGPGIEDAYRLGARGYIVKPFGTDVLTAKIAKLVDYWRTVVVVPQSIATAPQDHLS